MINNRLLLLIIFLGLIIRLLLISLPGFKIDTTDWFAWALRLSSFDYNRFYSPDFFSDYTPGYLYILSMLGFIKNLMFLPDNIFYFMLKIPAIISDLLIALFIYRECRNVSQKIAFFAITFFLFNPAVIFNSAVWGQIDSVLTILLLLSIVFLRNKRLVFSSIFIALALLVKPQTIALAPVFIFFLIKNMSIKNIFKLILPAFLVIFLLSLPFFPQGTLFNLANHILKAAKGYPYTSVNAYNLWGVVGFWINDNQLWNGFSYNIWGYCLLTLYWLAIGYFYIKKKLSLFALAALAGLAFFFLPTRVHERYLYPAIVFLILTIAQLKSKFLSVLIITLSFLHLFNLYFVYVYYNEFYLKLPKLLYNNILYNFLTDNSKNLSIISTMVFILISVTIIKYNATQKN